MLNGDELYMLKSNKIMLCYVMLCLSSIILLFVKICLSIVPFDVWDKLWVLIRPVPAVSFFL